MKRKAPEILGEWEGEVHTLNIEHSCYFVHFRKWKFWKNTSETEVDLRGWWVSGAHDEVDGVCFSGTPVPTLQREDHAKISISNVTDELNEPVAQGGKSAGPVS
jgi:hypothetical protein